MDNFLYFALIVALFAAFHGLMRMSGWRWRLYAWMARRERREELSFRVPNPKTVQRAVRVGGRQRGEQ